MLEKFAYIFTTGGKIVFTKGSSGSASHNRDHVYCVPLIGRTLLPKQETLARVANLQKVAKLKRANML